ncbi:hypothetical protein GGI12_005571 [Dipsacomyces acuminosporus]|nr:hypothetical protein GGI12_005571 [Dipsacomyces acuminosporus]
MLTISAEGFFDARAVRIEHRDGEGDFLWIDLYDQEPLNPKPMRCLVKCSLVDQQQVQAIINRSGQHNAEEPPQFRLHSRRNYETRQSQQHTEHLYNESQQAQHPDDYWKMSVQGSSTIVALAEATKTFIENTIFLIVAKDIEHIAPVNSVPRVVFERFRCLHGSVSRIASPQADTVLRTSTGTSTITGTSTGTGSSADSSTSAMIRLPGGDLFADEQPDSSRTDQLAIHLQRRRCQRTEMERPDDVILRSTIPARNARQDSEDNPANDSDTNTDEQLDKDFGIMDSEIFSTIANMQQQQL